MTRLRKSLEYERVSVNLSAVLMKMTGKTYYNRTFIFQQNDTMIISFW